MNTIAPRRQLVLGGAKSGKSSFAEQQVLKEGLARSAAAIYIATAYAGDEEMRQRIARHQADREATAKNKWHTIEVHDELGKTLAQRIANETVLVDCLTLWLTNCLAAQSWPQQKQHFLNSLQSCPANIVLVSNEISMGVVPMGEISRQFVDELGILHQELGQLCDTVTLMVAGFPTKLK